MAINIPWFELCQKKKKEKKEKRKKKEAKLKYKRIAE